MSSATPNEELRPGDSLGGWTILAHLASGGMGSVYAARNEISGATRALKVIKDDLLGSDDIRARFVREVSLASRVRHPNVVAAFDPLVADGRVVLPMELLEGETLAQRLARGPLAIEEAIGLGITLAGALTAFHAQGIIHRDLKPGNVFLAKDASGAIVPKILDLGAARELEGSKHTQTGHTVGSPSYMAPEQARAERDLDARVDVYALGVLLYVMLTCRRPIESDERGSAIAKLVQGSEILPPRAHRADVPEALEQIVLTAMARERTARFASAAALASALEGARAGAPASPREIPTTRPAMPAAQTPPSPAAPWADARSSSPPSTTPPSAAFTTPHHPAARAPSMALVVALGVLAFGAVALLGLGWTLRASLAAALTGAPAAPTTTAPTTPTPAMPTPTTTATPMPAPSPETTAVAVGDETVASDAREDEAPDAGTPARHGHGAHHAGGAVPRGAGLWLEEPSDDQK